MWHALRAEVQYFRVFLVGGFAISLATSVLVNVLVRFGSGNGPPNFIAVGLPGMFMVIAAMVVGFIAQGTRTEERRERLLLAGPVTPPQLAAIMIMLPTVFMVIGTAAAVIMVLLSTWLAGSLQPETVRVFGGISGQFFAIVQLGPVAKEAVAARRQRRPLGAFLGWALFTLAILVLVACQWYLDSALGHLGQLFVAAAAMLTSFSLYLGRSDFTR